MSEEKTIPENIDEKLSTIKYRPDEKSHLSVINQEKCKDCDKACTFFCPARVYEWDEIQQKLIIKYENCLECGACRIGCIIQNINWEYPNGGFGVIFKNS